MLQKEEKENDDEQRLHGHCRVAIGKTKEAKTKCARERYASEPHSYCEHLDNASIASKLISRIWCIRFDCG